MDALTLCHADPIAIAAPGEGEVWVQLLPGGSFKAADGRGPWRLTDPAGLIAASLARGPIPIDYDHAFDLQKGGPAAGAITELAFRGDGAEGGLWGRVEWTARARDAIRAREYRALSPAFRVDGEGRVRILDGAGLVNRPALTLAPITAHLAAASAGVPVTTLSDAAPANGFLPAVAALLALDPAVGEAPVLAALRGRVDEGNAVRAALGLSPEAGVAAVLAALAARAPDPKLYVPMAAHEQLRRQLAVLQEETQAAAVGAELAAARAAGRLPPAMEEWARELAARHGVDELRRYLAAAPVVVAPGASTERQVPPAEAPLDDAERQLCAQLGVTEAAYRAAKLAAA